MAVKKAARPAINRDELVAKLDSARKALPPQPAARRAAMKGRLDAKQVTIGGPRKPVDRVTKKGAKPAR